MTTIELMQHLTLTGDTVRKDFEALNQAIKEGKSATDVDRLEKTLKESEDGFNAYQKSIFLNKLAETENPVLEALKNREYPIVSHKPLKDDDGTIIGYHLAMPEDKDAKTKLIDIVDVCKKVDLSTEWQYDIQHLNLLLTVKTAQELGYTAEQIAKVNDSYAMSKVARQIKDGQTPTSNTQIQKLMQDCIDAILFIDDGKGANTVKANNRDFKYASVCYGRRSRALVVKVPNHNEMKNIIYDIMQRIVTNGVYTVDYKMMKGAH